MFNRKLVEIQAFRCDVGHLQAKPKNQSCKAVDPWNQLGENVIVERDVSFLGADFSIRHPPCLSPPSSPVLQTSIRDIDENATAGQKESRISGLHHRT